MAGHIRRQPPRQAGRAARLALMVALTSTAQAAREEPMIIDDRRHGDLHSALGTRWRAVTDRVMGGLSDAHLETDVIDARPCLRLRGTVSLANNGGFVQMSLDVDPDGALDASAYRGVMLEVRGNGETYNLHLKTGDVHRPWQSYRARFRAAPRWQRVHLPFADFTAHRIESALDLRRLRSLGVVAIGREMEADVCVARIELYDRAGDGP